MEKQRSEHQELRITDRRRPVLGLMGLFMLLQFLNATGRLPDPAHMLVRCGRMPRAQPFGQPIVGLSRCFPSQNYRRRGCCGRADFCQYWRELPDELEKLLDSLRFFKLSRPGDI
jgi:hypothetical protein